MFGILGVESLILYFEEVKVVRKGINDRKFDRIVEESQSDKNDGSYCPR